MTLKDAGFTNVTVYEASDRVGGRTYTRSGDGFFEAGQWSEWGGELIDTSHELVFALCKRFGFDVIDLEQDDAEGLDRRPLLRRRLLPVGRNGRRLEERQGRPGDQARHARAARRTRGPFDDPRWTPGGIAIDELSLYDWIETRIPGGHSSRLGQFIDVAYNDRVRRGHDAPAAPNLLGAAGLSAEGAWWVYGARTSAGRSRRQPAALARAGRLPRRVEHPPRLGAHGAPAQHRRHGDARRSTSAARRKTVAADEIVLALPLGVMKRLKAAGGVRAGVRQRRAQARLDRRARLRREQQARSSQIADRFWIGRPGRGATRTASPYADTGYQEAVARDGRPARRERDPRQLHGRRRLAPAQPAPRRGATRATRAPRCATYVRSAAQAFLAQIEPVFPGMTARWTGKASLAAWHVSPYQHGAYSVLDARLPAPLLDLRGASRSARSTSPASTPRRTSRATSRAAPAKASAPRTRSSTRTARSSAPGGAGSARSGRGSRSGSRRWR